MRPEWKKKRPKSICAHITSVVAAVAAAATASWNGHTLQWNRQSKRANMNENNENENEKHRQRWRKQISFINFNSSGTKCVQSNKYDGIWQNDTTRYGRCSYQNLFVRIQHSVIVAYENRAFDPQSEQSIEKCTFIWTFELLKNGFQINNSIIFQFFSVVLTIFNIYRVLLAPSFW